MKQILLTAILGVFAFCSHGIAEEGKNWKSIHLFQGFHYSGYDELPQLSYDEQQLLAALKNISFPSHHQVLLKDNGDYFAFNVCDLNLWKWNGNTWEKATQSEVSGYNCTPYYFLNNSQAYVLSGSGYWQNQADVFLFNDSTGQVDFVPTANQPQNLRGHVYFQRENGIYSLFGHQFDERLDAYDYQSGGFFLDLSSSTWQKLNVEWLISLESEFKYLDMNQVNDIFSQAETENYAVLELHQRDAKKSFWLIVDKGNLSIYIKEIPFLQITDSKWIQIIGDSIVHMGRNSTHSSAISLPEVVKSAVLAGRVVPESPDGFERLLDRFYLVLVLFPLGLMILGGWWIGLRLKSGEAPVPEEDWEDYTTNPELISWLSKLNSFTGKLIDQDKMDVIFDLKHIKNSDLRKVKRSRAIKAINDFLLEQNGKPAILRVRDTQDKRIIHYKIEVVPCQKSKKQLVKIR
jgi:hypothetical protein